MSKTKTKLRVPPLIMPVCLVGANVEGKPNFKAVGWFSLVDSGPNLICVSADRSHYTNKGIRENKTFSINIPHAGMVEATDYCGLYSGSEVDKSQIFDVFYGELKTAPMISDCPINIECKLVQTVELNNELFIGEIVGIYTDDKYLTNGRPDIKKIDPILFEISLGDYWKLGEYLAKAFKTGREYKPKTKQH